MIEILLHFRMQAREGSNKRNQREANKQRHMEQRGHNVTLCLSPALASIRLSHVNMSVCNTLG